jgi:serine phosphatase RsbU (regulator of sigma subunit)
MRFLRLFRKNSRAAREHVPVRAEFPTVPGVQLHALYSSSRIGGDFFDALRALNGRLVFLLMDIAGLRDSSLSIAAEVQEMFRNRSNQLFADDVVNESEAISELTLDLSRAVLAAAGAARCSPSFIASYSPSIGTLTYVNAGHMPGFVVDSNDILLLPSTGLPLGLFSHVVHDAQVCALAEGDAFVIASRGVAECGTPQQDFGIDGVRKALLEARRHSANELCQAVLRMALQHGGNRAPVNDMTALALLRESRTSDFATNSAGA